MLDFPYTRHEITNLLLTCRQIHTESYFLVLPNIEYRFNTDLFLCDFLSYFLTLSTPIISSLRHLSLLHGNFSAVTLVDNDPTSRYTLAAILPFFQGLQLDTLRIEGERSNDATRQTNYNLITSLVGSNGFKECVYTSKTDGWLQNPMPRWLKGGDHADEVLYPLGYPQPETWNRIIKEQNEGAPDASVKLFWVGLKGQRIEMKGRYRAGCKGPIKKAIVVEENYKRREGDRGPGKGMGIEVRIRRGADADYVQKGPIGKKDPAAQGLASSSAFLEPVWKYELDEDLREHAKRITMAQELKDWRLRNWQRKAKGRTICRSLLPKENPMESVKGDQ